MSAGDLNILMDWLDKVRTGIWLGMIYLNKNYRGVIPQFHIADRIGQKDRLLIICESHERDQGIGLSGVDTPIFHTMPSVCQIVINHLHLVTISSDFIIARQFGWPYVSNRRMVDINTDGFEADLSEGSGVIQPPILDDVPLLNERMLFQPIAHQYARVNDPESFTQFYGGELVRSACRDPERGVGAIFGENAAPQRYPEAPSDLWEPRGCHSKRRLMRDLGLWIAKLQRKLFLDVADYAHFPKEHRKARESEINGVVAIQDRIIQHIEAGGI